MSQCGGCVSGGEGLTSSTWKSPPVEGIRAISPIWVPNVDSSSWPNCVMVSLHVVEMLVGVFTYAARNIQRHCVQYVTATRGRLTGAFCDVAIFEYCCIEMKVSQHQCEKTRQAEVGLSIGCVIAHNRSNPGFENSECHLEVLQFRYCERG